MIFLKTKFSDETGVFERKAPKCRRTFWAFTLLMLASTLTDARPLPKRFIIHLSRYEVRDLRVAPPGWSLKNQNERSLFSGVCAAHTHFFLSAALMELYSNFLLFIQVRRTCKPVPRLHRNFGLEIDWPRHPKDREGRSWMGYGIPTILPGNQKPSVPPANGDEITASDVRQRSSNLCGAGQQCDTPPTGIGHADGSETVTRLRQPQTSSTAVTAVFAILSLALLCLVVIGWRHP